MEPRTLSCDLLNIAVKELNEDPEKIKEDLENIRMWLQKQPHLTARLDNQFLISFLRISKWSLQKAKERIDKYYTVQTLLPELFTNRDPFSPETQKILKAEITIPLPNSSNQMSPKIIYCQLCNADPEQTPFVLLMKLWCMIFDILVEEDYNFMIAGFQIVANFEKFPLKYLLQITPDLVKKLISCFTRAYPIRPVTFVGINSSSVTETFMNGFIKPLLSDKLKKIIHVYSFENNEKLYELVNRSVLPKELGGQNGSLTEAAAHWKEKVESYKDWYQENSKYSCNEKLRVGRNPVYNEIFGVDGSFRKLNID